MWFVISQSSIFRHAHVHVCLNTRLCETYFKCIELNQMSKLQKHTKYCSILAWFLHRYYILYKHTLTLDSHISCGIHCWWRYVSCWLAGILSSMGRVQGVEWEGEGGGWTSGSLSPHCDVTTVGHCSVTTGVQPPNSSWYISLNGTCQVVGLPRYWWTRACNDGNVVQHLCRNRLCRYCTELWLWS